MLLLDGGDFYQGSRYWHAFQGQPDIRLMNKLGYDAATLGNHDCDGGVDILAQRLAEANFPILCANMQFPSGHLLHQAWQAYIIKHIGQIRVAIFGLTIDVPELYLPDFRQDVQMIPILDTVQTLLPALRQQADIVILLSHLGHLDDIALAEAFTDIDLIIGSHTHIPLTEPLLINGTPIVRSSAGTQTMGRIHLSLNQSERSQLRNYTLVPLDASVPNDPALQPELAYWEAQLPPTEVLGQLRTPLNTRSEIKGSGESAAGNFFTDAMRAYFKDEIDIAMVHMGTLRGDRIYGAGDFTNHDLRDYHPFDNRPILMDLSAPQLKFLLERGVSALPTPVGTFLSQSGLQVIADLSQPAQVIELTRAQLIRPGQRIIAATYQGQIIDFSNESQTFRICMDSYMGEGGAGYYITQTGQNIRQLEVSILDILQWYLKHYSPVYVNIENRLIIN